MRLEFHPTKAQSITAGSYADKSLDKFFARFEAKVGQDRPPRSRRPASADYADLRLID
jgi:hypothetical protein